MSALEKLTHWTSPQEYLAEERRAEVRHEYLDGEVYAMAGASKRHNDIVQNIGFFLRQSLQGKSCRSFLEDVKVRVHSERETLFYYPDVFVACDPRDVDDYFCDYPSVIFEVLSPETARLDQREKRWAYQTIETLRTFVLVSQEAVEVTVWERTNDGWQSTIFDDPSGKVPLPSLGLELALAEIYAGIDCA